MNKHITLRDIAERMGVSSVTVSKALNDKEGVSDELKERIKQLADEMGYRINKVAKSMKEGLTYNIGVVIPERFTGQTQSFYLKVYQQISMTAFCIFCPPKTRSCSTCRASTMTAKWTDSSSLARSANLISKRWSIWNSRSCFSIFMTSIPTSIR